MRKLRDYLARAGKNGLCVAFSGGVDSALLLKIAAQELGEKVTAVTFSSRLSPHAELAEAAELASAFGVRHFALRFDEFEDQSILMNPPDRCYRCKRYIFTRLLKFSSEKGLGAVADGTNQDDLSQFRPGLRALRELHILSPLAECGYTKQQVRRLAQDLKIPVSNKPSSPCLATRIPYGVRLSGELLRKVESAEGALKSMGFAVCRVRAYGRLARVEISPEEFPAFLQRREEIIQALRQAGFLYVTLDMEGYRPGSMDLELPAGNADGADGLPARGGK